jgi:hypothetical protein
MSESPDGARTGSLIEQANGGVVRANLRYSTPTLTVYGSVREMTGSNSGVANGDLLGMRRKSDIACKENIVRIGEHPAGFGIYLFDYKPEFRGAYGHDRQFGVLAQEVERVIADAVSFGDDGYRRVDYAKLGIVCH